MLIKYGGLVGDARGSLGGTTFSRNHYGSYARQRTKPVDPGSTLQNTYRTRMAAAVVAWEALTSAQKLAWNAKGSTTNFTNRLGDSYTPTGSNLWVRSYNLLEQAGLTAITDPPIFPVIDDVGTALTFDGTDGLVLTTTSADWPAAAVLLVWYAIDKTKGTYFYKGPYPNATSLVAGDFTLDEAILVATAGIQAGSSQFAAWRLVGTDGSASTMRRGRVEKAPA